MFPSMLDSPHFVAEIVALSLMDTSRDRES